jgi:hypothetical protein
MKRTIAAAVYLWCYPDAGKSYAGWHLTADADGCASLLGAFDELASARGEHQSRLQNVIPPTAKILSVPGCPSAARSAKRLRIVVDRTNVRRFELGDRDGEVSLQVGIDRLGELRAHVEEIPKGGGDESIVADGKRPPREQRLWFWWMAK